ncbi:MAG: energy-coupling factor transporter ATPase, partial [Bacteroidales bacterium]|nr:energy-coupling factor transporter ATPase [Bacteroidales bacterium]
MLILNHISHIYSQGSADEVKALSDISLTISEGEFIAVIGHTGSGKSTLLQHMNGLLKPTSGEVLYNGEDVWAKGTNKAVIRSKVGLVFQYPEYQLFETDVFTDVCFGPKNMGLSKLEVEARAYEALTTMGLDKERWYASPFELSGGQKRRVAIAGVLAMKPEVLILDEPTAGLDPRGKTELLDLIKSLQVKEGLSVVLVSHSMDDVAAYADRVVVMDRGRIVMNDSVREVFSHKDELIEMGLGVPSVMTVMEELKAAGYPV